MKETHGTPLSAARGRTSDRRPEPAAPSSELGPASTADKPGSLALVARGSPAWGAGDSDVNPPVTVTDLRIVQRASEILDSTNVWNVADTRVRPPNAKKFSIYCALEEATFELTGSFEHRGAAMQQARFVVDELTARRADYTHRLRDYNNDPTTTIDDVRRFFVLVEARIEKAIGAEPTATP